MGYVNPLRHNLDGMAITAIRARQSNVDTIGSCVSSNPKRELTIMVSRFLRALQPGKAEVEVLYQQFLHAAQEAHNQIRANEERRRASGQEASPNVGI